MADIDKALQTMIANVEAKTGQSFAQLAKAVRSSGLAKHGELRTMLMDKFGLGHGHANMVVHMALQKDGQSEAAAKGLTPGGGLDDLYASKPDLRPIHERVLAVLDDLGNYEVAPKKGYVSYRRKKQFAMVGPKTKTEVEIGFSAKVLAADPRLKEMPPNSMCRYTTRVSDAAEVDGKVRGWLKTSFEEAGS